MAEDQENAPEQGAIVEAGEVSKWLTSNGVGHEILEPDHLGGEVLKVEAQFAADRF